MIRPGFLLSCLALAGCAATLEYWQDIPLPPKASVMSQEASDDDVNRAYLIVPTGGASRVHEFYRSVLGDEWESCSPSDDKWAHNLDVENHRNRYSAWWLSPSDHRMLSVSIASSTDPAFPFDPNEPNIILVLSKRLRAWDLTYRALCDPRNPALFSPMAAHYLSRYCRKDLSTLSFDAAEWRTGDRQKRGEMIADLLCRGVLLGLEATEIRELLGLPDEEDGSVFSYRISKPEGFGKYKPPVPPYVKCEEGQYDLKFNFDDYAPDNGFAPFQIEEVCYRIDS